MRDLKEHRIATSPDEAVAMLRAGPGRGCYLAGGTHLVLGREDCDFVVDINQAGLTGMDRSDQGDVVIGATTPLAMIAQHEVTRDFAGGELARAAGQGCGRPERGMATIGGSICHARPLGELVPVLLALDAIGFVVDEESQESLPLTDFFVGPGQTVLEDRLLAGLVLPAEAASRRCHALKISGPTEDSALVQVAVGLDVAEGVITTVRIVLGAVGPIPQRCHLAEEQLLGQKVAEITQDLIEDVALIAAGECDPQEDERASAEYRQKKARVLTRRLLCRALGESGGPECDEDDEGGAA